MEKVSIDNHDVCSECKNKTMPRWSKLESATARMCQLKSCSFVEERITKPAATVLK